MFWMYHTSIRGGSCVDCGASRGEQLPSPGTPEAFFVKNPDAGFEQFMALFVDLPAGEAIQIYTNAMAKKQLGWVRFARLLLMIIVVQ